MRGKSLIEVESEVIKADCPTCCHGPYPDDLVRLIKSAKPVGKPMTADEFVEWLKRVQ